MTYKEVINDLYLLKIESVRDKGYSPTVIDYAISAILDLQESKKIEVTEYKEDDFYEDLPFWMKEDNPDV